MRTALLLSALIFLAIPPNGSYRLTVSISGLKPLKGDLYISLHNRPEYFQVPDSAFMKKKVTVNEENETVVFRDVPAGTYAISLYHDENMDGVMETNDKGIPEEGYGFSTKSKFIGRPKFEQAAFEVGRNDTIAVKMIYHAVPTSKKDTVR